MAFQNMTSLSTPNMSFPTKAATMVNATFSGFEHALPKKIIKVMMYCILLVVSFTSNLLIIWVTSRDIRLRKGTTNILIANMAVSDLLLPLFAMPRRILYVIFGYDKSWLIDGDFGLALCKLTYYLQDVSLGVSIYSCVFIAIDRFYAVVHPLRGGLSRGKLKYIWIFPMAMFSDYLYSYTLTKKGDSTICIDGYTSIGLTTVERLKIYHFAIITLNFGIPLPIISFLYFRIALKLRRTTVPGQAGNTSSVRKRQNKNALKMSAVIVSLCFLSFVPLTVARLISAFGHLDSLSFTASNDLFFSVTIIAQSSCSYNVFIYLVFTKVHRRNFKNLFSKCIFAPSLSFWKM